MPTREFKSYMMPAVFLGFVILLFAYGTYDLYSRILAGKQASLAETVAALPPFDEDAAMKDAAKELGFALPLTSPTSGLDSVARHVANAMDEAAEAGRPKPDRAALELKLHSEAGYAKDSDGKWKPKYALLKAAVEKRRKAFEAGRAAEIEKLRESRSSSLFKLKTPAPDAKR
jgi:hypothetical protein